MSRNPPQDLALKYHELKQTLSRCARDPARPPELLAVSKGQPAARIRELFALGQRRFGENYAQELLAKAAELSDLPIEWVYIGHLQSNKIKKLVSVSSEIQTLAQWSHAEQLARAVAEAGRTGFKVFLEVKVDQAESKSGLAWDDVLDLSQRIQTELPQLCLRGLMAIPESQFQDSDSAEIPELYQRLRALADRVGDGQLSLGMSGDLRMAAAAGSDLVRVGQALMGPRRS